MAHFVEKRRKRAEDGSEVELCLDGHHAWFIRRPVDRDEKSNPLGAFRSEEAARTWADRHFPGGEWKDV